MSEERDGARPPQRGDGTGESAAAKRPRGVVALVVVLLLLAGGSVLGGIALTAVSACCGSPDEPDDRYALVGILVAAAVTVAAVGLGSGGMRRRTVLVLTAAIPLVCVVAAPGSMDLAATAPFAVAAWLLLWRYLRRPHVAAWTRG